MSAHLFLFSGFLLPPQLSVMIFALVWLKVQVDVIHFDH